jgi:hypothetical protein
MTTRNHTFFVGKRKHRAQLVDVRDGEDWGHFRAHRLPGYSRDLTPQLQMLSDTDAVWAITLARSLITALPLVARPSHGF